MNYEMKLQFLKFDFIFCQRSFIQEQMKDKSVKNAYSTEIILGLQHSQEPILIH